MNSVRRVLLALFAFLPAAAGAQATAPPRSETRPTPENAVAATTPAPRVLRYRFVPGESSLTFELPTTFRVIHGKADAWEGSIEVDPAAPGTLRGHLRIRAESIETGNSRRDLDVRDKVLEASHFPQIVFEAKGYRGDLAKFDPGATITAEVSGELSLHGVTRPIQTSLECAVLPDHVLVAGAVPVYWKAFGLRDMSRLLLKIKDPMLIVFKLWAVPE